MVGNIYNARVFGSNLMDDDKLKPESSATLMNKTNI